MSVSWWWLIIAFYAGVVFGFILFSFLTASQQPDIGDQAEEWLKAQGGR